MRRFFPTFLLLLALLGLSAAARAQGGSISGQVIAPTGFPTANASVRICPTTSTGTPCTPLTPQIFADPALSQQVANPTTTDGFGNYSIFVPAGSYYIVQITFTSNQVSFTYTYIEAPSAPSTTSTGPQFALATYTAPSSGTALGPSFADPVNGVLRTTSLGGLIVPGAVVVDNSVSALELSGNSVNTATVYNVGGTQIAASNLSNGTTGSGSIVLGTGATITTPTITSANINSSDISGSTLTGGVTLSTSMTGSGSVSVSGSGSFGSLFATGLGTGCAQIGAGGQITSTGAACAGGTPTLFYQTVQNNGSPLTQRAALSTDATLTAHDGGINTVIGMPSVGTAGTFGFPTSLTTDAEGRVTSVTAGSVTARTCNGAGCFAIGQDGTITEWVTTPALSNTGTSVTLPHTIPSTVIAIQCTDNSGRVQAGNVQAAGANVAGLSPPFSTFTASSEAAITAYCTVTGF